MMCVLILFLSLIAKFGYTSLWMIALSYITKLEKKKNTIVQCILLPVKKVPFIVHIEYTQIFFPLTQGVYSMVLGVFMVCIMASTMFLGAKIS
jgi:hypothetical protein